MGSETIKINENIVSSSLVKIRDDLLDLVNSGVTTLTLDLKAVDVIDSTGIGFLIRLQKELSEESGELILTSVNKDIVQMLKLMWLDQHITIIED
jgi:anti-anti-sigma factor